MFMPKLIKSFFYSSVRPLDFFTALRGGLRGVKTFVKDLGVGFVSRDLFCSTSLSRYNVF